MVAKLVTLPTFRPPRLDVDGLCNARSIELTLATFDSLMKTLNAILSTSLGVTTAVSQLQVSQLPIGASYVAISAVGLVAQGSTASAMFASVIAISAFAATGSKRPHMNAVKQNRVLEHGKLEADLGCGFSRFRVASHV
jgi:hypothetical protein